MVGQRFGSLTVIEMLFRYKNNKHTYCRCICDCGNEAIIEATHLQNRKNPSCGCMTSYYRSINNRTNEIGLKFNRLKILNIDYSIKPSVAICECECGSIIKVSKADVVSGHTKSCGCLQAEKASKANEKDFTGMRSKSGVVIKSKAYKNQNGVWLWNCICPLCQKIFIALPAKVMSNHTTSCGCKVMSSKERIIESILLDMNVKFDKQKRFCDCKYHYTLPFDFVVYNEDDSIKFLIEYDGEQHFRPVCLWGGIDEYNEIKRRDRIKTEYCKNKNILLLRLNYKHSISEIENIITNTIYA